MAKSVLEEYLVALGFKVDDQSYRKFKSNIEGVSKQFKDLGEKSLAAGAVLGTTMVVAANSMSKLYYSAQMLGTSVGKLQEFQFGAKQIGLSAEQASSSLMGMVDAMRNPGKKSILASWGIDSDEDPTKLVEDFADKLKNMAPYMQDVYAQMFGQDPHTIRQIIANEDQLKKSEGELDDFFKKLGYSPEEAAKQFTEFSRNVNSLTTKFEFLAIVGLNKILPFFENLVNRGKDIEDFFAGVSKETSGWASAILSVVSAIGSLTAIKGVGGILTRLFGVGEAAAAAEGAEAGAAGGPMGAAAGVGIAVGGYEAYKHRRAIKDWLESNFGDHTQREVAGHNPGNMRAWDRGNEEYFTKGKSGQFVKFKTDFDGLSAMAGQLLKYSQQGLDSASAIISKWAPSGDHNDTAAYIKDISNRLGVGADDHLNLNDAGTLDKLLAAMINHEQGFQPFSSDAIDRATQYRLGKTSPVGGATISQHTEINIQGVTDPQAAGRATADAQYRVNADLIRNFSSSVQ